MKKTVIMVFVASFLIFTAFQYSDVQGKDYYRTFEIIGINENGLALKDNDGNVIQVDKDPADYKVGYKVRYDSVRNRLRNYRWQDYEVKAVSGNSITLSHKSGDTITLAGNYEGEYKIGDRVRYDSVGDKLMSYDESGHWQQYTVVEATSDKIILMSNDGQTISLSLDNNIYKVPSGLFIPQYKAGDKVRYNASTEKIRKDEIRTFDWQDYEVKEVTEDKLILINRANEELVLENSYNLKLTKGDQVKYDRLNNLLKKAR